MGHIVHAFLKCMSTCTYCSCTVYIDVHYHCYDFSFLSCSSLLIFALSPPLIVSVTAIHHFPLAAGLLVGYSFGGFQLYSLLDSTLLYSLPLILRRLPTPVTHFAVQEPENDPKNFLYVWVSRNGPKAPPV